MMRSKTKGFTLLELLTVIAILSILAAILFPVLSSVKAGALRASCLSNFRNVAAATQMYLSDYDDRFMPVNYMVIPSMNSEQVDKTWVQLILPYVGSFEIFTCPADGNHRASTRAIFDVDLIPGDTYGQYYRASLLSNVGYNYLYLSPVYTYRGRQVVDPRSASEVNANMLLFVDSKSPEGGSYIVVPPCRRYDGSPHRDSFNVIAGAQLYYPTWGWGSGPDWDQYGRAWPWHLERTNVVTLSGASRSISLSQLSAGCDAQAHWTGYIKDSERYLWDME